jgi:hypothetical protein
MKRIIFTLALFCLSIIVSSAQDFAGKRIISGNLQLVSTNNALTQPLQSASMGRSNSNLTLSTTFLMGKIRANNTYTAYGFNLLVNSTSTTTGTTATNAIYFLGPNIQFGKFVKVFDQFYYAPNVNLNASIIFGSETPNPNNRTTSGFSFNGNISPLNFVYQVKGNILLSMNLGSVGVNYNHLKTSQDNGASTTSNLISLYGSVSNFSGIGAYYLF